MNWEILGSTFLFFLISYFLGSISGAIIISKFFKKEDIRLKGSGNAGATNVLRNYGSKWALGVFLLDFLKTLIIFLICWIFKNFSNISIFKNVMLAFIPLGAIIGHIWPIYFKFKGGKGIACTSCFIIFSQWPLFFIGFLIFILIFKITKIVALSSIFAIISVNLFYLLSYILNKDYNIMPYYIIMPFLYKEFLWSITFVYLITFCLIIIKHIPNIKRFINGNENSFKLI